MSDLSRKDYDQLALKIVSADRQLAGAVMKASYDRARKAKGSDQLKLILLGAAIRDALNDTRVTREIDKRRA